MSAEARSDSAVPGHARTHSAASPPLGFTWVRVNGEPEGVGISPGLYVDAREVAAYLRQYEAASVADALDDLVASNPAPTTGGWVIA